MDENDSPNKLNAFSSSNNSPSKKKKNGLEDLNLKIQMINFQAKNMQSSYAINNPY